MGFLEGDSGNSIHPVAVTRGLDDGPAQAQVDDDVVGTVSLAEFLGPFLPSSPSQNGRWAGIILPHPKAGADALPFSRQFLRVTMVIHDLMQASAA